MKLVNFAVYTALISLALATPVMAQTHRGKMDTDGILSPGELRNPRINYNRYRDGYRDSDDNHRYRNDYYNRHRDDYWPPREQYQPASSHFSYTLSDGIRSGRISRREEYELQDAAAELNRREAAYRRDGRILPWERDDLRERAEDLREKLQHELNDGERRY